MRRKIITKSFIVHVQGFGRQFNATVDCRLAGREGSHKRALQSSQGFSLNQETPRLAVGRAIQDWRRHNRDCRHPEIRKVAWT